MSDFWLMQWAQMRSEEMEQEANRIRLAKLARAAREPEHGRQGLVQTLLFRLGRFFESSGCYLQRRFGPKPGETCCRC